MSNHHADRAFWQGPPSSVETIAADRQRKPNAGPRAWRSVRRGLNVSIALAFVVLVLAVLAVGRSLDASLMSAQTNAFTAKLCAPFAPMPEAER